jgi:dihydropteroate synthase
MTQSDSPNLLQLPGTTLSLDTPKVMGILNVTPDSFSDGGEFTSLSKSIDRIGEMLEEGASIIDVGGESTRPGSEPVSLKDEINRVIPVIEKAKSEYPEAIFSVDTTKYEVAETALKLGVHLVNDVSGLQKEAKLAGLCAKYNAGYILMHSQGDPKTMQKDPSYNDVISDIYQFFESKLEILCEAGVSSLILDPGIGFGKTLDHNIQIIAGLQKFSKLRHPILIGASRKSMIGKILNNRPVEGRLAGTVALHYHALMNGAGILRVHDVREAADSIRVFNSITHH